MSYGNKYENRQFRERAVPSEWQEIDAAIEQLERAGWTVEPLRGGVRDDVNQPWLEMTKEISRGSGIEEMKNYILNQDSNEAEWPSGWVATIEADIQDAWDLEQIENAKYYIKLGYIGGRRDAELDRFLEFTQRIADAFNPKRTWWQRWLGRLGLSASS